MGLKLLYPKFQDIEKHFSRIKDGIIVFSLGSNIKVTNLDINLLNELMTAFERFSSHTFIWMLYEDINLLRLDEFDFPDNVHLNLNKFSLQQILSHPKTKLFISNGDYLSIQLGVWCGVPILGLPIFPEEVEVSSAKLFKRFI